MKTHRLILLTAHLLLAAPLFSHADDYPLKTCIVTDNVLGGDLGPAIDIHYKGRLVRLCCKSCVAKFNRDPEKYLKKLDDAERK